MDMKYCSKCKRVFFTDNERCECGKKFRKKYDNDSPVALIADNGEKREAIAECLFKADIPYSITETSGYSASIGRIGRDALFTIPLAFLKKGLDALEKAGLAEKPEWYDKLDLPDDPQWEEMPEGKRIVVKIVSILAFLVMIYLCVAGVDLIAAYVMDLFK